MSEPLANAVWCEECREYECVYCHDFNGTEDAVNDHADDCPDFTSEDMADPTWQPT